MELEPTSKDFQAFVRGMNDGYVISKFLAPDVAAGIATTKDNSPWFEGFRTGKTEFEQEKNREVEKSNENKQDFFHRPKFLTDRFNQTDPYLKDPDREKPQPGKDTDKDR